MIYFHGWGYTHHFFKDWPLLLQDPDPLFYNRGYDHTFHKPVLGDKKHIALTHSMGLFHLLEEYSLENFEKIIILNGFSSFYHCVPTQEIIQMQASLHTDPLKTVRRFYYNCGDKKKEVPANLDITRLSNDLDLLKTVSIYTQLESCSCQLFHLSSKKDRIVAFNKAAIPTDNFFISDSVPHSFSLTNYEDILAIIQQWISC